MHCANGFLTGLGGFRERGRAGFGNEADAVTLSSNALRNRISEGGLACFEGGAGLGVRLAQPYCLLYPRRFIYLSARFNPMLQRNFKLSRGEASCGGSSRQRSRALKLFHFLQKWIKALHCHGAGFAEAVACERVGLCSPSTPTSSAIAHGLIIYCGQANMLAHIRYGDKHCLHLQIDYDNFGCNILKNGLRMQSADKQWLGL